MNISPHAETGEMSQFFPKSMPADVAGMRQPCGGRMEISAFIELRCRRFALALRSEGQRRCVIEAARGRHSGAI
ncbi:hypothetical protein KKP04_01295 [Rhodomicrobium sp. Az07]|uniref:hypothetical protein n=1 Tax=Rhodomicrobium sp. Az07 TaxID=2839034 RepID=UPI001BE9C8D9|nr:hypothetical protein [Rhodomicrobium sp. Az07]MBT3069505.1 hypothetical protein [Rhodomicrobium sp. Az07]